MNVDVAIVGAGLTGLALAVALGRAGRSVAVVDARAPRTSPAGEAFDPRVYAIGPPAVAWLGELGVWQAVDAARTVAVEEMAIHGDAPRAGAAPLVLSAYRAGLDALCTIVEEAELLRALERAVAHTAGVTTLRPVECVGLAQKEEQVTLHLADGAAIQARLLVGCDGANSWTRGAAGITADVLDYGQSGVVANLECRLAHGARATQWFRQEAQGSSSVLAWLPLPGNRISVVWSVARATAHALVDVPDTAFVARLREAGGHLLGEMHLVGPRLAFPLKKQVAADLLRGRVALAGDAAHVIHPLAGQGLNLGFGDVAGLARALAGATDCGDRPHLRAWERARKAAGAEMAGVTHGLQRLFDQPHPALRALRNLGLQAAARVPFVSQALITGATRAQP